MYSEISSIQARTVVDKKKKTFFCRVSNILSSVFFGEVLEVNI